jgi:ATP-binding cassette subfamily B protein
VSLKLRWQQLAVNASYLPRILRLILAASKGWTIAWSILLVIQGLLPVTVVYLSRTLINAVAGLLGNGFSAETLRPAVWSGALMAGALVLNEVLQSAAEWVRTAQAELIQDHIAGLVHRQAASLDMSFYESPDFYDHLHRAGSDAASRPLALLENLGGLVQSFITIAGMLVVLLSYGFWMPVALVASTLPTFFVVLQSSLRLHEWWSRFTAERRWAEYYSKMMTTNSAAAEVRLFELAGYLQSRFVAIRKRVRTERFALLKRQTLSRLGASLISLTISATVMLWTLWRSAHGRITLGDIALLYQVFQLGQGIMHSLLGNIGQVYANSLFLSSLFGFLELRSSISDPAVPRTFPEPVSEGIRFRNVSFRYPGSRRPALDHFNLTIPAGKIVAIVGANGAGKSTLMKMLCRFYDPEAGSVDIDGIDVRQFAVHDLRKNISGLFQTPVPYHATAAENIALGDVAGGPQRAQIEAAARSAGADVVVRKLPQGYDTMLGKAFVNGADLSVGEWQRIAMSRALLKPAQIVVLDEPTSAMDSWSETEWFEKIREHAGDRTVVIITHRFTVAMRADAIQVMHEGRIVESGTHSQLVALRGLYADSWTAQMQAAAA